MIADHALQQTHRHGQPWRETGQRQFPPLGLANGISGIGHFYLRLEHPDEVPALIV